MDVATFEVALRPTGLEISFASLDGATFSVTLRRRLVKSLIEALLRGMLDLPEDS